MWRKDPLGGKPLHQNPHASSNLQPLFSDTLFVFDRCKFPLQVIDPDALSQLVIKVHPLSLGQVDIREDLAARTLHCKSPLYSNAQAQDCSTSSLNVSGLTSVAGSVTRL